MPTRDGDDGGDCDSTNDGQRTGDARTRANDQNTANEHDELSSPIEQPAQQTSRSGADKITELSARRQERGRENELAANW